MSDVAKIYWFRGNYFQRSHAIRKIREGLGECEETVVDDESSIEYLSQEVLSHTCFGAKKLVVVKGFPQGKGSRQATINTLKNLLANVPDSCTVVLDNFDSSSPELDKCVSKYGKVVDFPQHIDKREAPSWIVDRLRERGKAISVDVAATLCQTVKSVDKKGIDVDHLIVALKTLDHYVGKRKNVTDNDALAVAIDSREFVIWELFSCLDAKSYDAAMCLLGNLWVRSSNLESEIARILHVMVWRYRMLLYLKEGAAKGWSIDKVADEIQKLIKLGRKGAGFGIRLSPEKTGDEPPKSMYSSGMCKMAFREFYGRPAAVNCYKRPELFSILRAIIETIHRIRHGCTENEALLLFEMVIMTICRIVEEPQWRRYRKVCDTAIITE